MKLLLRLVLLISFAAIGPRLEAQIILRYEQNETVSWKEAIDMYQWLDGQYPNAMLMEAGQTDAGKPLHIFIISKDGHFSPEDARRAGKSILFINNGIHAGEPCGVDASLKLASGLLSGEDSYSSFLDSTVLVIVPVFNVGGALMRSKYNRANQNGPLEQGFRGNARNLDLNRDFVKLDSRNTRSLTLILREWEPDIFVDTHTSNGADYPYTITLINSHEQRHEPAQAAYLDERLKPFLFQAMKETPYEMSPYVWSYRDTPDNGIIAHMEYPRYASGYASLYNAWTFTVETHMFKPFSDRVLSTWHLLREFLRFTSSHGEEVRRVKEKAWEQKLSRNDFTILWELDTTRFDPINFKGFRATYEESRLTGQKRLRYNRNEPWETEIPYYRYFRPVKKASVPDYYVLKGTWHEVAERLNLNGVEMEKIDRDTTMEVEVSYIEDFNTTSYAYNGHYRHSDVQIRREKENVVLRAGDLIIPVRQKAIEYLVQTLEPEAYDSFFSWNFFDEILFRNEYFSPYIFEDTALELLEKDPLLKKDFLEKKESDEAFASSAYAQLRFIYERSPWSEPTYMRYPVYRLMPE